MGEASEPSRYGFRIDGGYGSFRGRRMVPPVVLGQETTYRRRGDARGSRSRPDDTQARSGLGPRLGHVWAPRGHSETPLLAPGVFWYIRDFGFCLVQFREYFICMFSEIQKQQKNRNWHCGMLS